MIRSPGIAIGWQLWRQHRTGIFCSVAAVAATALSFPVLAAVARAFVAAEKADEASQMAAIAGVVPMFGTFAYFMNALLFADEPGNVSSGYPRRMYSLPARTAALAGWPMLYGGATVAVLWAVMALLFGSAGFRLPLLVPSLCLVAVMAALQAVTWAPVASSWVRVALSGVIVPFILTPPAVLLTAGVAHAWVAAVLVCQIAATAILATAGVARGRQGEVWRLPVEGIRGALERVVARLTPARGFETAAQAQAWYEWRCHGLILPVSAASHAALLLGVGLVGRFDIPAIVTGYFATLAGLPLLMAVSLGGIAARAQPVWVRPRPSFAFLTTRPMTSAGLAAAKFRMAARSVLVTSAIIGGSVLIAVAIRPTEAGALWRATAGDAPGRAAGVLLLLALLYPLLLGKQATDALAIHLTGRRWLSNVVEYSFAAVMFAMIAAVGCVHSDPRLLKPALSALPWLVVVSAAAKGLFAVWVYRQALRRELVTCRFVTTVWALWAVSAACVAAAVLWWVPTQGLPVPKGIVVVGAVSFLPLARFALAPLATDWNRHR